MTSFRHLVLATLLWRSTAFVGSLTRTSRSQNPTREVVTYVSAESSEDAVVGVSKEVIVADTTTTTQAVDAAADVVSEKVEEESLNATLQPPDKEEEKEFRVEELIPDTSKANVDTVISQLEKKISQWKKEQQAQEDAYQYYQNQQSLDPERKPVYRREGKIDHYTIRPVHDQETERMLLDIRNLQERIRLTQAKIKEEQRVEQVKKETAERFANIQDEIAAIQQEAEERYQTLEQQSQQKYEALEKQAQEEMESLLQQFKEEKEITVNQLEEKARTELEAVKLQAKEEKERLQAKQEQTEKEGKDRYERLQEHTATRIMEKDKQIEALTKDIIKLTVQLQDKKCELSDKEKVLASLEKDLEEKEAMLDELWKERESLRKMVKQSWRVVKDRFKKRVLRKDGDDTEVKRLMPSSNIDKGEAHEKEKVLVGLQKRKSSR